MIPLRSLLPVLLCLWFAGCSKAPGGAPSGSGTAEAAANENGAGVNGAGAEESRTILLTPENAKIRFVGKHMKEDPDPNPRTGAFRKLSGKAEVDEAAKSLEAVSVEFQTDSLSTGIDKLDTHLKNEDFFDVRQYPTAKFESTRITPVEGKEGEYHVVGNLTLLKGTKEVSFPATISFENGFALEGELKIDRTEYGMDRLQDSVRKEVEITVEIAEKK
ncbi:MAG: YceI family protein [Planctomycetaceae bacterium]